jgi:hypothetical protein
VILAEISSVHHSSSAVPLLVPVTVAANSSEADAFFSQ